MKQALVTGSSGLIGRHVSARLRNDDWNVQEVDVKTGCDARDFFREGAVKFDLVIHCAAHVGGRVDIEGRPTYIGAMNLMLDGALFEWALRTRPAHIIYWSSSAAYPTIKQDDPYRLREDDIDIWEPEPSDNTYGWAKLAGERLAWECKQEGLKVHVLRPFSGYGPGQSLDYPFPSFIDRARRRVPIFDVWGDGEQVRDFIHVDDVVSGALAAVEQDHPGPLNLCTGVGTSFNQLAELVCKSAGYAPQIQHRLDSPVGVRYRVGDPTEMLKVCQPRISLEDGVKRALRQERGHAR